MKVLLAHTSTRLSGVRTWIQTVAEGLHASGHTVLLSFWEEDVWDAGITDYRWLRTFEGKAHVYVNKLPAITPDIALLNSAGCIKPLAGLKCRKKFVVHGLMNPDLMPPDGEVFDEVLCLSPMSYEYIQAPEKRLVPNVVNTEHFRPETEPGEQLKKVLLADVLYAPAYLPKLFYATSKMGLYLCVAGDMYNGSTATEDMMQLYNSADLVIGYGRVALEAMACGRPVIVYGVNGGDGYVTPDNLDAVMYRNCSGWSLRTMPPPGEVKSLHFIRELFKYKKTDGGHFRGEMMKRIEIQKFVNIIIC